METFNKSIHHQNASDLPAVWYKEININEHMKKKGDGGKTAKLFSSFKTVTHFY